MFSRKDCPKFRTEKVALCGKVSSLRWTMSNKARKTSGSASQGVMPRKRTQECCAERRPGDHHIRFEQEKATTVRFPGQTPEAVATKLCEADSSLQQR